MEAAPFRQLPGATAPPAEACYVPAADGVRLRLALWRPVSAPRATVLIFPGRGEYCEKYAPITSALTAAGHAALAIDWRGQGGSDRLAPDPATGHVADFSHYQHDVAALMQAAQTLRLPRPWHGLAHSMGGAIILRALNAGLPLATAAFSAPMWGLSFGWLPAAFGHGLALGITSVADLSGQSERPLPGAATALDHAFATNRLTSDLEEYIRLMREAAAWPDLVIGPPSYGWAHAALAECTALAPLPSPRLPALISLGGHEAIVSPDAIRDRAAQWPGATLLDLPDARHEAMIERAPSRRRFLDATLRLFTQL